MKDFENDLIYYPNPDPVKEPRFILKSVDELEKSTKYSVTCNGTERVVYHTDSFDYVVVDNEAYDLEISIHWLIDCWTNSRMHWNTNMVPYIGNYNSFCRSA